MRKNIEQKPIAGPFECMRCGNAFWGQQEFKATAVNPKFKTFRSPPCSHCGDNKWVGLMLVEISACSSVYPYKKMTEQEFNDWLPGYRIKQADFAQFRSLTPEQFIGG